VVERTNGLKNVTVELPLNQRPTVIRRHSFTANQDSGAQPLKQWNEVEVQYDSDMNEEQGEDTKGEDNDDSEDIDKKGKQTAAGLCQVGNCQTEDEEETIWKKEDKREKKG